MYCGYKLILHVWIVIAMQDLFITKRAIFVPVFPEVTRAILFFSIQLLNFISMFYCYEGNSERSQQSSKDSLWTKWTGIIF